jgi:hypothetical protein
MAKASKPPQVAILGIFAKAPKVTWPSSKTATQGGHPGHLRITTYYYERKKRKSARRWPLHVWATRAREGMPGKISRTFWHMTAGASRARITGARNDLYRLFLSIGAT